MREADDYPALVKGARADGWLLYRISDDAPGRKPFDCGGCAPGGLAVALECKLIHGNSPRWPAGDFLPHQVAWLRKYSIMGGVACATLRRPGGDCRLYLLPSIYFESATPTFRAGLLLEEIQSVELHRLHGQEWRGWPGADVLKNIFRI